MEARRPMTSSNSDERPGEFELIRTLFAPLTRAFPGAFGLTDDVAVVAPLAGHDIVLKTDAIVEGVHFFRTDPPETVAKKALRTNISDFAAKGAVPHAYLLALALPDWPGKAWLEKFAHGLEEDQAAFDVVLAGGDTDRTPGALTIAVMMTGFVPEGILIRRDGASPGDAVFVTGTIGDAGGGLHLLLEKTEIVEAWQHELVARYRMPQPRLAFGKSLRGMASAALDVSDGLIADLGHIAELSRVRIEIDAARVPLSAALIQLWGCDANAILRAAGAGDDYEIAFTAPVRHRDAIAKAAAQTGTRVTEIGRVVEGEGAVLCDAQGRELPVARKGHVHF